MYLITFEHNDLQYTDFGGSWHCSDFDVGALKASMRLVRCLSLRKAS